MGRIVAVRAARKTVGVGMGTVGEGMAAGRRFRNINHSSRHLDCLALYLGIDRQISFLSGAAFPLYRPCGFEHAGPSSSGWSATQLSYFFEKISGCTVALSLSRLLLTSSGKSLDFILALPCCRGKVIWIGNLSLKLHRWSFSLQYFINKPPRITSF